MKLRLPAAIAALAAILLSLVWVATPASAARTNDIDPDCAGVNVDLRSYQVKDQDATPNHVQVWINGTKITDEQFGSSFAHIYLFENKFQVNTWRVKVHAWDDNEYSFDTGVRTTTPCAPPTIDATPIAPTVTPSTECEVEGSLTIPTTEGVEYLLDGEVVDGTLTGPLTGTVTARATEGYTLTDPYWSVEVNIPAAEDCSTEATPIAPTVTPSTECEVEGSLTIPTTPGIEYLLDGEVVDGTLTGPLTGTVTARATEGYTLTDPYWSVEVNIPAAEDCSTEATPIAPTVTPSTECEVEGSLTIPTTPGIEYLLDGEVVDGTLTGPLTGTVTARATEGYTLTDPYWSVEVNIQAAEDCEVESTPEIPQPAPTPTEVGVLHQSATAAPTPPAGAALASTGSSLTGYATAAAAALLAGTVLMMASRRRREPASIAVQTETD